MALFIQRHILTLRKSYPRDPSNCALIFSIRIDRFTRVTAIRGQKARGARAMRYMRWRVGGEQKRQQYTGLWRGASRPLTGEYRYAITCGHCCRTDNRLIVGVPIYTGARACGKLSPFCDYADGAHRR